MLIVLCLLAGGLLGLLAAGTYFANLVINPRVYTVEETYSTEIECGRMNEAEWLGWEKQEVRLRSPFGYELFGVYLPLPDARRTVIIAHGITYSLFGSVKYVNSFRKRGFNVLLYDHRNHGRSGGNWSTFGYYEKRDLAVWFAWAQEQSSPGEPVGLMGESFGAATAIQFAAENTQVAFLVSDCAFSDLYELLALRLRAEYALPAFPLLSMASLCASLLSGMSFEDVSPIHQISQISCPVFFAHGQNDHFTPCWMSEALYQAKTSGVRTLYLAPNADHAEAYWNNRDEYDRRLGVFLESAGIEMQAQITP